MIRMHLLSPREAMIGRMNSLPLRAKLLDAVLLGMPYHDDSWLYQVVEVTGSPERNPAKFKHWLLQNTEVIPSSHASTLINRWESVGRTPLSSRVACSAQPIVWKTTVAAKVQDFSGGPFLENKRVRW
jgi:hypothetical protein